MPGQSVLVEKVERYFEYAGRDVDRAHEIYHEDAVLEFPQSGERFEGLANFREWRRRYPAKVSSRSCGSLRVWTWSSSRFSPTTGMGASAPSFRAVVKAPGLGLAGSAVRCTA